MIQFYEEQNNRESESLQLNALKPNQMLPALRKDFNEIKKQESILQAKLETLERQQFQSQSSSQHKYTLKGIIIHQGNVDYGHYYSFVNVGDKWLCCDDMRVEVVDEERVFQIAQGRGEKESEGCYCLVYVKSQSSCFCSRIFYGS